MSTTDRRDAPPSAAEVLEQYRDYYNPGWAALVKFMGFDTVEDSARGVVVRDRDGNEYIDCLGGFGALSLGHCHPKVVAAVREQLERMPLTSKILLSAPLAALCRRLADVTPGDLQYSFICNSGAEAVEGALKLARLATGRTGIVGALNGFHGKTFGALSASGRDIYRKPFEPLVPGFSHVPFGDADAMRRAVTPDTAAVILEPIQGEAGVIIPPDDYLPAVRDICDDAGALLILDEVQTGFGRTGALFACQHYDVVPDIMTLAKSLGGGVMPVGAFTARPHLWEAFRENPILHSTTFGGNPLACAAGCAAIDAVLEERLPERALELGAGALGRLADLRRRFPAAIAEVRGRGLLIGIEFAHEDIAGLVIAGLAQRRIIAAYTINNPRVIRLEPPLVIDAETLNRVIDSMSEAIEHAVGLLEDVPSGE
ncbi:MAG: aminotransferase class III-fold pyridoxal phosphate-dependent enzyme [Armatimonadota bacterium]|nr:MAG: aminotransferase class III-fold pyridoxal phosphate-dependent enzyme [Armatimonadota bacterium]